MDVSFSWVFWRSFIHLFVYLFYLFTYNFMSYQQKYLPFFRL